LDVRPEYILPEYAAPTANPRFLRNLSPMKLAVNILVYQGSFSSASV
jgi:hypothetical protein